MSCKFCGPEHERVGGTYYWPNEEYEIEALEVKYCPICGARCGQ